MLKKLLQSNSLLQDRELMNTAVLTGRQVYKAMKVFIVSQSGKVADITLQSSCHSEDESVIKVQLLHSLMPNVQKAYASACDFCIFPHRCQRHVAPFMLTEPRPMALRMHRLL